MGLGTIGLKITHKFPCLFISPHINHNDRAEFILDIIDAGATATLMIDWHATWQKLFKVTATIYEI